MIGIFITVLISVIALVVSVLALYYSIDGGSRCDSSSQPETQDAPGITITLPNGGNSNASGTEVHTLELDTENLDRAYVVYADNHVEALDLEDMETSLNSILKRSMDEVTNIVAGKWCYRYFFLYTADLYGEYDLHLIYTKSSLGEVQFNVVSGIEVYGLAKAQRDDYIGEPLMAQKYVQLLKELPDYLPAHS